MATCLNCELCAAASCNAVLCKDQQQSSRIVIGHKGQAAPIPDSAVLSLGSSAKTVYMDKLESRVGMSVSCQGLDVHAYVAPDSVRGFRQGKETQIRSDHRHA